MKIQIFKYRRKWNIICKFYTSQHQSNMGVHLINMNKFWQKTVCEKYDFEGMKISTGGGRRRGTGKDPTPPPNQGLLNRANTMVYNPSNTGYGGFSYTSNSVNSGARPQFYLNQIPYVQPPSQTEYVEWFSRYMLLI